MMAISRINASNDAVEWHTKSLAHGQTIFVCKASEEEWNAFVDDCDGQAFKSTFMEWANGAILIVELPSLAHGAFSRAVFSLFDSNPAVSPYSSGNGSTRRRLEPDEGFDPDPTVLSDSQLPHGIMEWGEFYTLKVEVGATRRWGLRSGHLGWKANQYTVFPGVEYILCVIVDEHLQHCTYKLYCVDYRAHALPHQDPADILAPTTLITFDARRLLGIPPHELPRPYSTRSVRCFADSTATTAQRLVQSQAQRAIERACSH